MMQPHEIVRALVATSDPPAQAALLRLTLGCHDCAFSTRQQLAPVSGLTASADAGVRRWAPLALLRLSHCTAFQKEMGPLRQMAADAIASRLRNLDDADVARDVTLVGQAGGPIVPAIVARLEHRPRRPDAERRALLAALAAMFWDGQAAMPALSRMLKDPAERPLRAEVLDAIARTGSTGAGADELDATLLNVMATDPPNYLMALEALASPRTWTGPGVFSWLVAKYHRHCATRPVDRDRADGCRREGQLLSQIAEEAGLDFERLDIQ
jgi:hypothetical protein